MLLELDTKMGRMCRNSIHLVNGAVLTHTANTTLETHKLDVAVTEQILVDSTSSIDVSGKGYRSGYTTGNTTDGGATNGGGSYGGRGRGSSPQVYGDYAVPKDTNLDNAQPWVK